jgi:hypothetical protein
VHAEHAEAAELGRELERDPRLLEPLPHVGQDAVGHEAPDGVADEALLVVEEVVDREEVLRAQVGGGGDGGGDASGGHGGDSLGGGAWQIFEARRYDGTDVDPPATCASSTSRACSPGR